MFKTLTVAALALTASATHAQVGKFLNYRKLNLCYVSMNNTNEFIETKTFVDKIQSLAGQNYVNVQEFQEKGKSPEETVKNIIRKGIPCDGLVISGHHTGAFGGKNAGGSLSIDQLEKLACESKSKNWFSGIHSLWLQGCRTLGALNETDRGQDLADYHANRVNAARNDDGLTENQWALMDEFATILDSETPYAARFLKVFYKARVYGWTETAPGEKNGSDKSLVYHIHNTARLMASDKTAFAKGGPFTPQLDRKMAIAYLDALRVLLGAARNGRDHFVSLAGWRDQGNPKAEKGIYGLYNSKLNFHRPLATSDNSPLVHARELECTLREGQTPETQKKALKEILQSESSIAMSFYALRDVMHKSKQNPGNEIALRRELLASQTLAQFLKKKLSAPNLGLARKVEYYGFYRKMTGVDNKELFEAIRSQAFKVLERQALPNEFDLRDTKATVFRALADGGLITAKEMSDVVSRTNDNTVVEAAATALKNSPESFGNFDELVTSIYNYSNRHSEILGTIINAFMEISVDSAEVTRVMRAIESRVSGGQLPPSYWTNLATAVKEASAVALKLNMSRILQEAVSTCSEINCYSNLFAALNLPNVSSEIRKSVVAKALVQFRKTPLDNSTVFWSLSRVAELLASNAVTVGELPDAVAFVEESMPALLGLTQNRSYHVAIALKAMAAQKSTRIGELTAQIFNNDEPESALEILGVLALDPRTSSVQIPVPALKKIVASPAVNSESAFTLSLAIIRLPLPDKARLELFELLEKAPGLTEVDRGTMYVFMAKSGGINDGEMRRRVEYLLRQSSEPLAKVFATLVTLNRPSLYADTVEFVRQMARQTTGLRAYMTALEIFAILATHETTVEMDRKITAILARDDFDEETASSLSPGSLVFVKLKNLSGYVLLLDKLRNHRSFSSDLRQAFLVDLKNIGLLGVAFSEDEVQAIRASLAGPK